MSSGCILTALELDISTAMEGGATAEQLTSRIDGNPRAAEILLHALVAPGFCPEAGQAVPEHGRVRAISSGIQRQTTETVSCTWATSGITEQPDRSRAYWQAHSRRSRSTLAGMRPCWIAVIRCTKSAGTGPGSALRQAVRSNESSFSSDMFPSKTQSGISGASSASKML